MSAVFKISKVEKLSAQHVIADFKCGKSSMDLFLRKHALANQAMETSQTWVVHRDNVVLGYYTLVFGGVGLDEMPPAIAEGLPPYQVGIMLLARWAVDKKEQGQGIGKALLKDALIRTVAAADIAGLKAIVVDAIDEKMAAKYREMGFVDCPVGERRLMVSIETVRASLGI